MIHTFSFPTKIHFGFEARTKLGEVLREAKAKKILLVTDKGVAGQPFFADIQKDLMSAGFIVAAFSDISGNPVKSQVLQGVQAFKKLGGEALVGIGGGAALDVTKAIALLATHSGDLFDYEDGKPGALPIGNVPFWVAIPTTAGTGSEVGRSSVISDDSTHVKKIIFSPNLLAPVVLADPELTLGLPPTITAATGMDALTHCIESFLAKDYHPICDGIALEGLRLSALNLALAVKTPSHREARASMLLSSMMGAIAFQKGLGLTHSCAHALSTVANLHHGLANALMIDHALKGNLGVSKERFERMSQTIGLKNPSGENFLKWLTDLKATIGIPKNLSDAGIKRDDIKRLAKLAFEDSCHLNNPTPVTESEFEKIFNEAI